MQNLLEQLLNDHAPQSFAMQYKILGLPILDDFFKKKPHSIHMQITAQSSSLLSLS